MGRHLQTQSRYQKPSYPGDSTESEGICHCILMQQDIKTYIVACGIFVLSALETGNFCWWWGGIDVVESGMMGTAILFFPFFFGGGRGSVVIIWPWNESING